MVVFHKSMSQVKCKINIDQDIPKEKKVKSKLNPESGVRHTKMGKCAKVGQSLQL
jgi:hypothetical protein